MQRIFVGLMLSLAMILFTDFSVEAEEPLIKHPNLEEAIKYQLGVDSKIVLRKEQLESLTLLDASWWNVTDLSGIENAANLSSLYLEGNNLKDIRPLSHLSQIQHLVLTDNEITNLSPLQNYQNLSLLQLSNNRIADISPLASVAFTGIEGGLSLSHNEIVDLTPLTKTRFPENPRYFYVDVSYNRLTSLNGLQNAVYITELSASNNQITTIDALHNLGNLKYVDLTNNNISTIVPLANSQPKVIKMANNKLETLNGLQVNADQAYYFEFQNNKLYDITALTNLTEGYVNLANNNISDISPLINMKKGSVLLNGNPLAAGAMEVIYVLKKRGVNVTYDSIALPEMDKKRLAGNNRYYTAVKISQKGWTTSENVIIARSDSFPDALAGVPLAYELNAPILLTDQNRLVSETKNEIKRLKAKQAIILGGTGAISSEVEASLKNMGLNVKRIAGNNRFATAKKIAEEIGNAMTTAVIAYGYNFPDALAAASYAAQNRYPILLTDQNKLPKETKEFIKKVKKTIVVGGEGVVGKEVIKELPNPTRIGGNNRFDTATKMITVLNMAADHVFVANGYGFADSLTGSVLAAKMKAPLLLVEKDSVPKETRGVFVSRAVHDFTVLGGDAVVYDEVIFELSKLLVE
jgi:putative cell wall-binding protein/Leucine-rich repeat (LRR) protein